MSLVKKVRRAFVSAVLLPIEDPKLAAKVAFHSTDAFLAMLVVWNLLRGTNLVKLAHAVAILIHRVAKRQTPDNHNPAFSRKMARVAVLTAALGTGYDGLSSLLLMLIHLSLDREFIGMISEAYRNLFNHFIQTFYVDCPSTEIIRPETRVSIAFVITFLLGIAFDGWWSSEPNYACLRSLLLLHFSKSITSDMKASRSTNTGDVTQRRHPYSLASLVSRMASSSVVNTSDKILEVMRIMSRTPFTFLSAIIAYQPSPVWPAQLYYSVFAPIFIYAMSSRTIDLLVEIWHASEWSDLGFRTGLRDRVNDSDEYDDDVDDDEDLDEDDDEGHEGGRGDSDDEGRDGGHKNERLAGKQTEEADEGQEEKEQEVPEGVDVCNVSGDDEGGTSEKGEVDSDASTPTSLNDEHPHGNGNIAPKTFGETSATPEGEALGMRMRRTANPPATDDEHEINGDDVGGGTRASDSSDSEYDDFGQDLADKKNE